MARKVLTHTIAEFSDLLVKFHRLPHGTTIRLQQKKNGHWGKPYRLISHYTVNAKNLELFDDDQRVKELLDNVVAILAPGGNLKGSEFKLVLAGETDGCNGHTSLSTVRSTAALPSATSDAKARAVFTKMVAKAKVGTVSDKGAMRLYDRLKKRFGDSFEATLIR